MENHDHGYNKNVSLSLIAGYGASDSDSDDTETHSNDNLGNDDSDAAEISEMVLKNNIINACAHGPLSRASARDDPETTRHMIIDSSESGVVEYEVTEYRDMDTDSDSSSDSSDSEVDSVKDIEESSGDEAGQSGKFEQPKVRGELVLDDLPPIEDLAISLPAKETTKIGTVASIVDRLVIVRAFPETPAIDLDSVLFLENGAKALGKIFDVFGPVTEPHYCVRFNSADHVKERGIAPGMEVFMAPKSEHTSYVFLSELMKTKGSDASWLNDIEPPPHQVEYSDDEEERRVNRARKETRRESETDGETSNRKDRRSRPSESSSRFGSWSNRGRNPFATSRRNNMAVSARFGRPAMDARTPPPHGEGSLPPPMFARPPWNNFQFGAAGPFAPPPPPFPMFPPNFCAPPGPPHWMNNAPPPPPGT